MDEQLKKYISDARSKSVPDEQIKTTLINAGWQEVQVTQALVGASNNDLVPPPPPPPAISNIGMWTGFLYIIFFISLYILATSIGGMFHQSVDKFFPVPQKDSYDYRPFMDSYLLRGYIAAIIVSYPIFMGLAIYLKKQLVKQPLVTNLRVRKILIYITLIITFLIMMGHIIWTLYDLLSGNITMNASGHLMVTVLIAGSIFCYFLNTIIHDRKTIR